MPTITAEQLGKLKDMVAALSADKEIADQKTQASNAADTVAAQANAAAAQAKQEEAAADAKVSDDVTQLEHFIESVAVELPVPSIPPSE